MKRLWNPCARHRESICLLAAGALPEAGRGAVENHLAACADCRNYFDEIKRAATPFANWKKDFAHLEPDQALQERWAKAVRAAGQSEPVGRVRAGEAVFGWCREVIWPCRRAWAGMAALWLVMWTINARMSGVPNGALNAQSATATTAMIQTLAEQRQVLAELFPPVESQPAEPPRQNNTRPRSEVRTTWGLC